jgi:hypothetical protein
MSRGSLARLLGTAAEVAKVMREVRWPLWVRILAAPVTVLATGLCMEEVSWQLTVRGGCADPRHLYAMAMIGFGSATFGAWVIRHRWAGCALSAALGALFGGVIFLLHGAVEHGLTDSGGYSLLRGDRGAGLFFFAMAMAGGVVGTRLGGLEIPSLEHPLTAKRVLLWLLLLLLVLAFWIALLYAQETFIEYLIYL